MNSTRNYQVRKIRVADAEGFHAALDSVVNEKEFLLTAETPTVCDTRLYVGDNVENNHAHYICVIDDEVIGWADIIPYRKEMIRHAGLLGMGIVSEHRGNGQGKALLLHAIEHVRATGLKRVELEVFARNSVAISLYRKFGFEHEGTKRRGRYINDSFEDVFTMALWCG